MRLGLAACLLAAFAGAVFAESVGAIVVRVGSATELELKTDDGRRTIAALEGIESIRHGGGGVESLKQLALGKRVIVVGETRGEAIQGTVYVPLEARPDRLFSCASLGCNEIDLRREQVRRGWARVSQPKADIEVLLKLEQAARDNNRGDWE